MANPLEEKLEFPVPTAELFRLLKGRFKKVEVPAEDILPLSNLPKILTIHADYISNPDWILARLDYDKESGIIGVISYKQDFSSKFESSKFSLYESKNCIGTVHGDTNGGISSLSKEETDKIRQRLGGIGLLNLRPELVSVSEDTLPYIVSVRDGYLTRTVGKIARSASLMYDFLTNNSNDVSYQEPSEPLALEWKDFAPREAWEGNLKHPQITVRYNSELTQKIASSLKDQ